MVFMQDKEAVHEKALTLRGIEDIHTFLKEKGRNWDLG